MSQSFSYFCLFCK